MKIIVRHALYIETEEGHRSPCGARLNKSQSPVMFPRDCIGPNHELRFDFDDAETAKRAAIALEKYLNKQNERKEM